MNQKILSLLLSLCLLTSICLITAVTVFAETEGIYTYNVMNGEATITDCSSDVAGDITIPNTLGGYPVTAIGRGAFEGCDNLTSVIIPNGVTTIRNSAFYDCINLTNVTIPNGVITIEAGAFGHCISLTDVTIPDSVTTIGLSAFIGCDNLTEVMIPNGVVSIGLNAFEGCGNLTDVTIPESVTFIGDDAFGGCDHLSNISVSENNIVYSSEDGNLFDKNKTTLIQYAIGKADKVYRIPDGVTTIEAGAFNGCVNLTNVTIPSGVTTIGNSAFEGCGNLTDVTIPDSVTTIGSNAFAFCGSLARVTIPDSVTTIGRGAFEGCNNLTDITIPSGVTTIGKYAFVECGNLRNIRVAEDNPAYSSENGNLFDKNKTTLIQYAIGKSDKVYRIPNGVVSIGDGAFADCDNLTEVMIPSGVTTIGKYAFVECGNLRNIRVAEDNPAYSSENGNLFDKNKTTLIQYAIGKSDKVYRIPNGVTTIETGAFYDCDNLTEVMIPNGVVSIGDSAFAYCDNLTNITIPDSVTFIGELAFYACDNLTDVYYTGSEEVWDKIDIGFLNESLTNATIHYNWKIPGENNSIILTIGELSANVFGTVKINDVAPQIVNGRTMLPARFVTENLGATVTWSPTAPELVMINKENINIVIYIGSDVAYVNGQQVLLDSPAFLENGRTYTPVRFIAESLGAKVGWNQITQEVTITP